MDVPEIYFDSPENPSSYIKVIGVGGGGGNAVNHMFTKGIQGVDFIVANTDTKALGISPVPTKLVLGNDGLGAGGRPQKGRRSAEAKAAEIKELFEHNTKMIFITAGMGGGTGTGAAPVIARIAKEIKLEDCDEDDPDKILVVAVVTTPFEMEGTRRFQAAKEGIDELRKYTDSILIINNEKLRSFGNLGFSDAFAMANDVLLTAVKGIAEIITLNAYVNIDFCDVNTVMANSGTALMGVGEGDGENRALQAIEQATTSVLLNDNDIAGTQNVLLYMSWSSDNEITMDEWSMISEYLREKTGGPDTNVIWGAGTDDTLGTKLKITIIATGFEQKQKIEPVTFVLTPDAPIAPVSPTQPAPAQPVEPTIINRPDTVTPVETPQNAVTKDPFCQPELQPIPPAITPVEPVAPAHPGRVIPLEDTVSTPTPSRESQQTEGLGGIVLKNRQDAEPESKATPTPVHSASQSTSFTEGVEWRRPQRPVIPVEENSVDRVALSRVTETRAERIKRIHDMLRNQEDGPDRVARMNPMELMGEPMFETKSSAESESSATLNPDGSISANPSLHAQLD